MPIKSLLTSALFLRCVYFARPVLAVRASTAVAVDESQPPILDDIKATMPMFTHFVLQGRLAAMMQLVSAPVLPPVPLPPNPRPAAATKHAIKSGYAHLSNHVSEKIGGFVLDAEPCVVSADPVMLIPEQVRGFHACCVEKCVWRIVVAF